MAQLRDKITSEHVFTGTPLECAAIAKELPEVIFDDVGGGFDPTATTKAHDENVAGLTSAAAAATGEEKKRLDDAVLSEKKKVDDALKHVDRVRGRCMAARNK